MYSCSSILKGKVSPATLLPIEPHSLPSARVGDWIPMSQSILLVQQHPRVHHPSFHLTQTHRHAHTDLFTTVTCLCMGISLDGPLPAAGGKADRPLSTVGFTTSDATPLPRDRRGTGLLLPSSCTPKGLGCRKVPLGFPKEFTDVAVSNTLLHPTQRDFKRSSNSLQRGHAFLKDS